MTTSIAGTRIGELRVSTGVYVYEAARPMGGGTFMPAMWWRKLGDDWRPGMIYSPDSLFSQGPVLREGTGKEYIPAQLITDDDARLYREFCETHGIAA